jgi:hypothetical protein
MDGEDKTQELRESQGSDGGGEAKMFILLLMRALLESGE